MTLRGNRKLFVTLSVVGLSFVLGVILALFAKEHSVGPVATMWGSVASVSIGAFHWANARVHQSGAEPQEPPTP